jgi:hypothetical protein
MKRIWTIIGVADVARASSGTSRYLDCRRRRLPTATSGKSSTPMERSCSVFTSGVLTSIPRLTSPHYAKPGNGLLLFFRVDNFDIALPRARALVSRLEKGPHVNPSTGTAEFSLRDPDGYYVTVSSLNAA